MSKKCNACGAQVEDQAAFCQACGSADLIENEVTPTYQEPAIEENTGNGNVVLGIVGAVLLALVGGIVYFAIYQLGVIAGISGLIIFLLANLGYRLFARTKNKNSIVALVVSIVLMIIVIFLAECFCVSFEFYSYVKEMGDYVSIFDAIEITPELLADSEIQSAVIQDLAFAYIFGFVASISNIVSIVKSRKKKTEIQGE